MVQSSNTYIEYIAFCFTGSALEKGSEASNTTSRMDYDNDASSTGQMQENGTDEGGECTVYIWLTSVALLNTLILLMLLHCTIYHIYSVKIQEARKTGKRGIEVKMRLKTLTRAFLNKNDSQVPKNALDERKCEIHEHLSPNQESKRKEKRQCFSQLALPVTNPPPCPDSETRSFQDFNPSSDSQLKNSIERNKGRQLPPLPSTSPPHPNMEMVRSSTTTNSNENHHEYESIELSYRVTPLQQQHQAKEERSETNAKEKVSSYLDVCQLSA